MSSGNSLRRSKRQHVPTSRARNYNKQREGTRPMFPSVGDDIIVQWVLNERKIWWPATILKEMGARPKQHCMEIVYHEVEQYPSVEAQVIFSTSRSGQRFVKTLGDMESSSWLYSDEEPVRDDQSADTRLPADESSSERPDSFDLLPRSVKRTLSNPPAPKRKQKRMSSSKSGAVPENQLDVNQPGGVETNGSTSTPNSNDRNNERTDTNEIIQPQSDFGIRLRLIERQLQDNNMARNAGLSTSAHSVIVSLRWALLRALEKPLKNVILPDLDRHGLALSPVSVSSQCDYYTFREISAALCKEHPFSREEPKKSRVAFSPAFHTTQSGSSASNDMNILFSCLADLTAFLRIRDDNDFETILSKEVVCSSSTLLRVLGTFRIIDQLQDESSGEIDTPSTTARTSTNSVNASSENVPVINLFVGSSPICYDHEKRNNMAGMKAEDPKLRSSIFQQECRHFCSNQKTYRAPWRSLHVESKHLINACFHLDGTVQQGEIRNHFVLNWSRQPAPSPVKWTRDIHEAGSNLPGYLRLSVPAVVFSASRNVNALVSILDHHIETFMRFRSSLHSLSSFK